MVVFSDHNGRDSKMTVKSRGGFNLSMHHCISVHNGANFNSGLYLTLSSPENTISFLANKEILYITQKGCFSIFKMK